MKTPTEEQKALLGMIEGPVWHDCCQHGNECYIGSFGVLVKGPAIKKYDLYVFAEHKGQHVCIRDGNEDNDYISPGSLASFVQSACIHNNKLPEYWSAFMILKELGRLKWEAE